MNQLVSLIGFSYLQAQHFANQLAPSLNELGDSLFLANNHMDYILRSEHNVKGILYNMTFNFEECENEISVLRTVHLYMEDIITDLADCDSNKNLLETLEVDLSNIVETGNSRSKQNPYLKSLKNSLRKNGLNLINQVKDRYFGSEIRDLSELYIYQHGNDELTKIYNQLFVAIKYELILNVSDELSLPGIQEYDCRNNCLTLSGQIEENQLLLFLKKLYSYCRGSSKPFASCVNNVVFTKDTGSEYDFILSTYPVDHPKFLKQLTMASYIHVAFSEEYLNNMSDQDKKHWQVLMKLLPASKTDYYMVKDIALPLPVSQLEELASTQEITISKILDDDVNISWSDNNSDTQTRSHGFFRDSANEDESNSLTEDMKASDMISINQTIQPNVEETEEVDLSYIRNLFHEVKRVGVNGFSMNEVIGFDTPITTTTTKSQHPTELKAIYTLGDTEVECYLVTSEDYLPVTILKDKISKVQKSIDDLKSSIESGNFVIDSEAVSVITRVIQQSVKGISLPLETEESTISDRQSRVCFEGKMRDKTINLLLAGDCKEMIDQLMINFAQEGDIKLSTDTDIEIDKDASKLALIYNMYHMYSIDATKYWINSLDEDLLDENVPNLEIYKNLLTKLFSA